MKRSDLLAHLSTHGCRLEREGARHSIWINLHSRHDMRRVEFGKARVIRARVQPLAIVK